MLITSIAFEMHAELCAEKLLGEKKFGVENEGHQTNEKNLVASLTYFSILICIGSEDLCVFGGLLSIATSNYPKAPVSISL